MKKATSTLKARTLSSARVCVYGKEVLDAVITSTPPHLSGGEKKLTPVEELLPYSVEESTDYFSVEKDDAELCLYWKDKHPNPKAAAEAECKRLNEEYRKEEA